MLKDQGPKNDQDPMTNRRGNWSLELGHSLGLGHWSLVLDSSSFTPLRRNSATLVAGLLSANRYFFACCVAAAGV